MVPSTYAYDHRAPRPALAPETTTPHLSAPSGSINHGAGVGSTSTSTSSAQRSHSPSDNMSEGSFTRARGSPESASSVERDEGSGARKRAKPQAGSGGAGRRKGQEISLACYNCRSRKVKCDSQRPTCSKCVARGDDCNYDIAMKRRGPDKGKRRGMTDTSTVAPVRSRPTASPPTARRPSLPPPPPPAHSVRTVDRAIVSPPRKPSLPTSSQRPARVEPYPRRPFQPSPSTSAGQLEWTPPPLAWQQPPPSSPRSVSMSSPPPTAYPSAHLQQTSDSYPHPAQHHPPPSVRLPPFSSPHFAPPFLPPPNYPQQGTPRRSTLPFDLMALTDPAEPGPVRRQSSYTPSPSLSSLAPYGREVAPLPSIRQGASASMRLSNLFEPNLPPPVPSHPPQPSPHPSAPRYVAPLPTSPTTSHSHTISDGWSSHVPSQGRSWAETAPTVSEEDPTGGFGLARHDQLWQPRGWTGQQTETQTQTKDQDQTEGKMVVRPASRARLGLEDLLSPQLPTFEVNLPASVFHDDQTSPPGFFSPPIRPSSPFRLPRAGTPVLYQTPTLDYLREIWFDVLLRDLGTSFRAGSGGKTLSREGARRMMLSELATLWKCSQHWLSFIHVPTLMSKMLTVEGRRTVQPSLIYILLALAVGLNSYEGPGGRGFEGGLLSLRLREEAEGIMWSSYHGSGEFHEDFAKVAFLIVLFELGGHPLFGARRKEASIWSLDRMMLRLSVDPYVGVRDLDGPLFATGEMPRILPPPQGFDQPVQPLGDLAPFALRSRDGHAYAFWGATPRWPDENSPYGTPMEIRKEQTRRLIWNAAAMGASLSVWRFNVRLKPLDLFICRPESYAVFLPAEHLFYEPNAPRAYARCNVWALQSITFLLWDYAIGLYHSDAPQSYKDAVGMEIWEETIKIERLFDAGGIPGSEMGLLWQQRDWMINIRVLVSERFQRAIPLTPGRATKDVVKEMALIYLRKQSACARALLAVDRSESNANAGVPSIKHRSAHIFLIIMQACRALDIFSFDPTMVEVLKVIRDDFMPVVETILNLYPSAGINLAVQIFLSLVNEVFAKVSTAVLARMSPEMAAQQTGPAFPPLRVNYPEARSAAEVEVLLAQLTSGGDREMSGEE